MKFKPILILFFFFCMSIQIVAQENVAAATIEQLEKDGFKCCVLKGQGNNLLYPNVYSRTPGDIDVWLLAKAGETKSNVGEIIKYVRQHNPK